MALLAGNDMLALYDERVERSKTENMTVKKVSGVHCVLKVQHVVKGRLHTHHVLVGLHRGIVLLDDDCDRARVKFKPKNCNISFFVAKGFAVYENLPGFVPIACTCKDYATRGTSSVNSKRGIKSVNHSNLPGKAGIMGAVLGCKHMAAANQYLNGGTGACAYFDVER